MGKSISRSNGCLTQRRRCPCGDEQCYLKVEGDEEIQVVELLGDPNSVNGMPQDSNPLQATTNISSEITTLDATPYLGQSFRTDNEAEDFYMNFARRNGFAIRRERSKGNATHPMGVYKRELACRRAGVSLPRKTTELKRQRNKKSTRCKCEAQMVIKKTVSKGITRWVIVQFSNEHNHELLDSEEVRHLSAYRSISSADREQILDLAKGGCTVNHIMRALELQKGLKQGELTFTERDLRNFLQASKNINRENEGEELLNACKIMQEKTPGFCYKCTMDENGRLEHIAWSYPDSVRAYEVFGDVVIFDTTYRLYAYDRPVGVWFGLDNYGTTIFFGFALLRDEKPQSFQWALQSFVHLMDGRYPQTMLTDLDMSLRDAILSELPHTKHAFSMWHITSKLPRWFSPLLGFQYDKFLSEFHRISNLESVETFEQQWTQMVVEFGLTSDRHIAMLSYHRARWALPYLRGCFLAGLMATGFSLSMKPFFKSFLNSQTHLKDFVEQVGVAIDFQSQAGEEAMLRQNYQNMKIRTCMPIEEHAITILTNYAFEMFQKELVASTQLALYETGRGCYVVRHHLNTGSGYIVTCTSSDEEIHCSCYEFETSGILCRHVLRVLSSKNYFQVPDKYLLARWRRESSLFPKSSGYKYRSQALRSLVSIIIQESSATKNRFNYVQWHMSKLLCHVRDMPTMEEAATDLEPSSSLDAVTDIISMDIPPRRRGRPEKVKGPVEVGKETVGVAEE